MKRKVNGVKRLVAVVEKRKALEVWPQKDEKQQTSEQKCP